MYRRTVCWLTLAVVLGVVVAGNGQAVHGGDGTGPQASVTSRRVADPKNSVSAVGPVAALVYSNTLSRTAVGYGPGVLMADDVSTIASDGCSLDRFEILVTGDTDGQGTGPFSVDVGLYDACPSSGGSLIAGTVGHADLPDAGSHLVTLQVPGEVDLPIPATLWVGVTFSRLHAGWVGGAPALVGYSDDLFDQPFLGCTFHFGGFPSAPHGSFHAQIYVRGDCVSTFFGYRASTPRRGSFTPGVDVRMADDIRLNVDGCDMVAYEVVVRGAGTFRFDLREAGPGAVIDGTQREVTLADNFVRLARFTFDPPIRVPARLWFTIVNDALTARALVVGRPAEIGETADTYAVLNGDVWTLTSFQGTLSDGALYVTVTCAGSAPLGACCDMFFTDPLGDAVCREVGEINCAYPPRGSGLLPAWKAGATCDADSFDPPCGAAACCRADGTCEDRTANRCEPGGVSWHRGVYCTAPEVQCEFVCVVSEEPCTLPHAGPGCEDPFCCAAVCDQPDEDFCCRVEWDQECVNIAARVCQDTRPINDECVGPRVGDGARLVVVSSSTETDGVQATENPTDPGFCCHADDRGAAGVGTVWYKFVATDASAQLHTCLSNSPADDSLMQVFSVGDPTTEKTACNTLSAIACGDDAKFCSDSQRNSRLCIHDLVPGNLYYVLVAAKSEGARGAYRLTLSSPCADPPPVACDCPGGPVTFIDPPNGVVDARRPHDPNDPALRLGIDHVVLTAPPGANALDCWTFCETDDDGSPNSILSVVDNGGGTFTINLARPLTAGAVTTIAYNAGDGTTPTAVLISHPSNTDADAVASPSDVVDLAVALEGTIALPWGVYSTDVDDSGFFAPPDLLEEVDLLNGAATYAVWEGTTRPTEGDCKFKD